MISLPSKVQTAFCSPSRMRSFGATPLARKPLSWSETYCSGLPEVICVAVSDMRLLLEIVAGRLYSDWGAGGSRVQDERVRKLNAACRWGKGEFSRHNRFAAWRRRPQTFRAARARRRAARGRGGLP